MPVVNVSANQARTQAILRPHAKFSMIFVVDANGNYVPQKSTRTLFDVGIDDAATGTYALAGYNNATGASNSIDITDVAKGGALSSADASVLLAASFLPENEPRVGLLASGAADTTFTSAVVPRRGGLLGDVEAQMMARLMNGWLRTSQMSLLPQGSNTSCSIFLGLPQLQAPGIGQVNSDLSSIGFPSGSTRYTFGDDVIVFPNKQGDSEKPNRIQIDFPTIASASTNDDAVELIGGMPARAAGTVVAIDCIFVVDYANIHLYRLPPNADGSEQAGSLMDPNAMGDGTFDHWRPASDFDAVKVNAFRRCI